ncbi:N-lysine methyltransferase KMT5A-like [Alosa pseudoharengus]|uniref:N-lysine methyltransferase KMT5A-like n=1 Tax=Alosa pseudoharengus TaxID=34774 RepID=UPI003F8A4C48
MLRRRRNPMREACDHARNCRDTEMLEAKFISPKKGRGVFTLAPFQQGDFVVEYRGVIIDAVEAQHRRKIYHKACCVFLFDFKWKGKWWCIDAALEDNSLGRLVNDDHKTPNCRMKLIEVDGKPHLCLFALRDICQEEEITYNYGGTDWPWRNESEDATCSLENVPSTSDLPTSATQGEDATCSLENVPSTSDLPTCATQVT